MWKTSSLNLRNKKGGASPCACQHSSISSRSVVNMPVNCRNLSYTKAKTLFCTMFLRSYQDPFAYLPKWSLYAAAPNGGQIKFIVEKKVRYLAAISTICIVQSIGNSENISSSKKRLLGKRYISKVYCLFTHSS